MQDAAGGFVERLAPADRRALLGAGRERSFGPGEALMSQGGPSDSVVLLLRGAVRVVASTPDGLEATLSLRAAGDILGTLGVLTQPRAPRAATVLAVLPVRARIIGSGAFLQLLHDRPAIAIALLADLADQWRESSHRHLQLGAYPVAERLAGLLVELCSSADPGRATPPRPAGAVEVPLSQTDLAGMIGASRESTARALGRFREEGLVATGRRAVRVVDLDALRARAHPPQR